MGAGTALFAAFVLLLTTGGGRWPAHESYYTLWPDHDRDALHAAFDKINARTLHNEFNELHHYPPTASPLPLMEQLKHEYGLHDPHHMNVHPQVGRRCTRMCILRCDVGPCHGSAS
eukprot:SAG31_NODE_20989_length_560_cov_0.954447_1_plen_116_part_00